MDSDSSGIAQGFIDLITFNYNDEAKRHILEQFRNKRSLFDEVLLEEHLGSQPVLLGFMVLLLILSISIFILAGVFVACRAFGKCGARRYQPHPTSGKTYAIYVGVFAVSWILMASCSLYFVFSGLTFWGQKLPSLALSRNITRRMLPVGFEEEEHQLFKREASVLAALFNDADYNGDFELSATEKPLIFQSTLPPKVDGPVPIGKDERVVKTETTDDESPAFKVDTPVEYEDNGGAGEGRGREEKTSTTPITTTPKTTTSASTVHTTTTVKSRVENAKKTVKHSTTDVHVDAGTNEEEEDSHIPHAAPVTIRKSINIQPIQHRIPNKQITIPLRPQAEILFAHDALHQTSDDVETEEEEEEEVTTQRTTTTTRLPKTKTIRELANQWFPPAFVPSTTTEDPPRRAYFHEIDAVTEESNLFQHAPSHRAIIEDVQVHEAVMRPIDDSFGRETPKPSPTVPWIPVVHTRQTTPPPMEEEIDDETETTYNESVEQPSSSISIGDHKLIVPYAAKQPKVVFFAPEKAEKAVTQSSPQKQYTHEPTSSSVEFVQETVAPTKQETKIPPYLQPDPTALWKHTAASPSPPMDTVPEDNDIEEEAPFDSVSVEKVYDKTKVPFRRVNLPGEELQSLEASAETKHPVVKQHVPSTTVSQSITENEEAFTERTVQWTPEITVATTETLATTRSTTVSTTTSTTPTTTSTSTSTTTTSTTTTSNTTTTTTPTTTTRRPSPSPTTTLSTRPPTTRETTTELLITSTESATQEYSPSTKTIELAFDYEEKNSEETPVQTPTQHTVNFVGWNTEGRRIEDHQVPVTVTTDAPIDSTTDEVTESTEAPQREETEETTTLSVTQPPQEGVGEQEDGSVEEVPSGDRRSEQPFDQPFIFTGRGEGRIEEKKRIQHMFPPAPVESVEESEEDKTNGEGTEGSDDVNEDKIRMAHRPSLMPPRVIGISEHGEITSGHKETIHSEEDQTSGEDGEDNHPTDILVHIPPRAPSATAETQEGKELLDLSTHLLPFYPLHTSASFWFHRLTMILIVILMTVTVFSSMVLVVAGTVCYLNSYHPMDRTQISNKIGQGTVIVSTVLLFTVPLVIFYSDIVLSYAHIHSAICPLVQEKIRGLNPISLDDSNPIVHSLVVDLEDQCVRSVAPVQGLWIAAFLFSLSSLIAVFSLFKLSKYYLRMKTEYYWSQPEIYGTVRQTRIENIYGDIGGNIYGTTEPIYGAPIRPKTRPPPPPDNHYGMRGAETYGRVGVENLYGTVPAGLDNGMYGRVPPPPIPENNYGMMGENLYGRVPMQAKPPGHHKEDMYGANGNTVYGGYRRDSDNAYTYF